MDNDPNLLNRAKQMCPNSYMLVRVISERIKQLGRSKMNGQLCPRLIHCALQEIAAGQLRLQPLQRQLQETIDRVSSPQEIGKDYAHT